MKLLAIVDIHKSESALSRTQEFIEKHKPDLLLIGGDITTFTPLAFAREFLASLSDIRTLALPGNCDPPEILSVLDESAAVNLHGRKETIEGITFVGLGGSNATPFNTPFELEENEIFQTLDHIMEPGAILVLHFPVFGHLDEVSRGEHAGSKSALKIVEKYQPSLVITGHIHETRGTKTDDNGIIYVNPGPMKNGYAALVEIEPTAKQARSVHIHKYDSKIQMLSSDD